MSAIGNPRPSPVEAPEQPAAEQAPPKAPRAFPWKGLVALAVIGAGGYAAWQLWLKPKTPAPAATAVVIRTTKVAAGTLERTARVAGQTSSQQSLNIVAPILRGPDAGREMILLFLIQSGSRVKKGDLLAQIDAQSLMDHLDEVRDSIQAAEADIRKRKAEQTIDMENLKQSILLTKSDFEKASLDAKAAEVRTPIDQELLNLTAEEAEARYKRALSDVAQKEIGYAAELRILDITKHRHVSHLDRHKVDVERFTMRSPIDGMAVVQQTPRGGGDWNLVQQGDQVFPGQIFMKVVDPERMQVEGFVNQTESSHFRIGQEARIRLDAFAGLSFPGKVFSIGAIATGGMRQNHYIRNVPVKIAIHGSDQKLIPDLSASVDVLLEKRENAKTVPLSAVARENGKETVFVKKGDRFERRAVTLGLDNGTHVEVLAGLETGEEIALQPAGVS